MRSRFFNKILEEPVDISKGLIHHMKFEDNITDSITNDDYQLTGISYYYNKNDRVKCIYLNDESYLYSGVGNSFGYNNFTYCVWARSEVENTDQGYHTVFEDGNWPNTTLAVRRNPGAKFDTFSTNIEPVNSYDGFNKGIWYFIVVRRVDNTIELFIDSNLVSSVPFDANAISNGGMTIGTSNHSKTQTFKGFIASLRIYDRALNLKEIEEIYKLEEGNDIDLVAPVNPHDVPRLRKFMTNDGKFYDPTEVNDSNRDKVIGYVIDDTGQYSRRYIIFNIKHAINDGAWIRYTDLEDEDYFRVNIPGLKDYNYNDDSPVPREDKNGKRNTQLILEYAGERLKDDFPSIYQLVNYSPGTHNGEWYLPSMGELVAVEDNKFIIEDMWSAGLDTSTGNIADFRPSSFYHRVVSSSTEADTEENWYFNYNLNNNTERLEKHVGGGHMIPFLALD